MAKWIHVNEHQGQTISFDDSSFPFGVYTDIYNQMDANGLPCHWHNIMEFALVLSGQVETRIDDEPIILDEGDCVFINSNTLHSSKQIGTFQNAVVCTVSFSTELLTENKYGSVFTKYFKPIHNQSIKGFKIDRKFPSGQRIHELLYQFSQMNKQSYGYELTVISKISSLWLETLRYINDNTTACERPKKNSTDQNNTIKLLLLYIQENYDKNISIDSLSNYAYISRSECFRCFKKYTGKSPVDYLNEYRLQQAEYLLRTTSLPILNICLSCGFSGQSYFGKLFKLKYNLSPSQFRKREHLPEQNHY